YSHIAMVTTLSSLLRAANHLEDFITARHLYNIAKILLVTGLIVTYGYLIETFISWYSGNEYEWYMTMNRLRGPYAPLYWALILCNSLVPQVLGFRRARRNGVVLFVVALVVNVGMWLGRFIIVVTSLHRGCLPSSGGMHYPTR